MVELLVRQVSPRGTPADLRSVDRPELLSLALPHWISDNEIGTRPDRAGEAVAERDQQGQHLNRESDIVILAQSIIQDLTTQAERFPKSPHSPLEVRAQLDAFLALRDALVRLQAQLAEAGSAKQCGLNTLSETLRAVLRYVEHAGSEDPLAHFGWSGRRAPAALQPPGQFRLLEAPRQGAGWVFLDWKKPSDGGRLSVYVVEVRSLPDGRWQPAATALTSEATLVNQGSGHPLEYRVHATNKAGNVAHSNVVEVRL